jgi:hypothetical protein
MNRLLAIVTHRNTTIHTPNDRLAIETREAMMQVYNVRQILTGQR